MAIRSPDQRDGRGATVNTVPSRFGLAQREADGDWLDAKAVIDGEAPSLRTTVTIEQPRTIISRNASPDVGFDRSINPYRGCDQHRNGCVKSIIGGKRSRPSALPKHH